MNKSLKIYVGLLLLLFVAIIYLDKNKPKPVNWIPTYALKDKIPFGLYVLDQEAASILKPNKIEKVGVSPYEFFVEHSKYENSELVYDIQGSFFSVGKNVSLDHSSIVELCVFVGNGNSAFISSETMDNELLDSLHLKMDSRYNPSNKMLNWVANKKLGDQKYNLVEGVNDNYFSKIDTLNTTVLGYQKTDSLRVNFIKVPYKKGTFYLHTQPVAFTNFHLLKANHYQYAQKVLSYVPNSKIFWFTNSGNEETISNSPMRYIFSQPALKWAWLLFLMGMVLFILFNVKRKQRVVPIIKPLTNTTIEFTKTIGNLYYQEGDHTTIIDKKIIYFLEKVRTDYLIETNKLDDDFIKKLHQKSGKKIIDIENLVRLIHYFRKSSYDSVEADLIEINNAIEKVIRKKQ